MSYLRLLDLEKEPFSNSPDPDFFFASGQHMRSLQRLELSIRLRKGLSVVLGEVGTGKTTLCRRLIRRLDRGGAQVDVHLFLDPEFAAPGEFLRAIVAALGIGGLNQEDSERDIKEAIKQYLFSQGVDRDKITVLIIDEGQKLPGFCLEILREFLNFETNQYKLLQIVIFAQQELRDQLRERANFSDRIAEFCSLTPLNFADTRRMILFRLRQAHGRSMAPRLFSFWAMVAVYRQTGGYPRKIVQLCSQTLLTLIIQNKTRVTASLVRACGDRLVASHIPRTPVLRPALLVILLGAVLFWQWDQVNPAVKIQMAQTITAILSSQPAVSPAGPPLPLATALHAKPDDGRQGVAPEEETVGTSMATLPEPERQIVATPQSALATAEKVETVPATLRPAMLTAPVEKEPGADDRGRLFRKILADQTLFPTGPVLGKLRITDGDSLSRMIRRVYGDFNSDLLQMVSAANPHLADTDLIPAGTMINFPAACRPCRLTNQPGYRLLVGRERTLSEADRLLKECRRWAFQAQLVPVWQPESGLTFLILSPVTYLDPQMASLAMQELPREIAASATTLHNWEEAYIFFSQRTVSK